MSNQQFTAEHLYDDTLVKNVIFPLSISSLEN